MNIEYRDGLIFTSLQIDYRGSSKVIENVVVDTGAAETIISPDAVDDIGIVAESDDSINSFYGVGGSLHSFFSKKVDNMCFGEIRMKDIKVDFGMIDPSEHINGLLGLDVLKKVSAVIDLKKLVINMNS